MEVTTVRDEAATLASLYVGPETPAWPALHFADVFKIFRSGDGGGRVETVALRGLELEIAAGELVAVIGPSGCGKSTFLHLAAGLDEPSAGDVSAFGTSLSRLDEAGLAAYRARETAVIFQSENLWPGLTARENASPWRAGSRVRPAGTSTCGLLLTAATSRCVCRPADMPGTGTKHVLGRAMTQAQGRGDPSAAESSSKCAARAKKRRPECRGSGRARLAEAPGGTSSRTKRDGVRRDGRSSGSPGPASTRRASSSRRRRILPPSSRLRENRK
jgi:ABC-type Fe3+/spermidine/putrescine transport system ATPase subunit